MLCFLTATRLPSTRPSSVVHPEDTFYRPRFSTCATISFHRRHDPFCQDRIVFFLVSAQDLDRTSLHHADSSQHQVAPFPLFICCFASFFLLSHLDLSPSHHVLLFCLPSVCSLPPRTPIKNTPDKRSLSAAVTNVSQHQPPRGFAGFCPPGMDYLIPPTAVGWPGDMKVSKALMTSDR